MSGILGVVDCFTSMKERQNMIEDMADTIKHRGLDSTNYWISSGTALANCNFLINDPKSIQPISKDFGSRKLVLTFDGEIYNFRELKRELEDLGHIFYTDSDSEVILDAYSEWGENCLNKFEGMFAFGIWDDQEQTLLIVRDQLGSKPLYYFSDESKIIFASEIKVILKHENVEASTDYNGLCELFAVGPATTPGLTPFTNIYELRSGHILYFNKGNIDIKQYFTLRAEKHTDDLDTTVEKVRYFIEESVKNQMKVDAPKCVLLSGGLDSSSIVAFMSKNTASGQQLNTVSMEYQDNDQFFQRNKYQPSEDKFWISQMSNEFGTKHEIYKVNSLQLADNLKSAMIARDIPGMADIDSSLYSLFTLIKNKYRVIFSGECGDEIFGGYPWFVSSNTKSTFPWMHSLKEMERVLKPELVGQISMHQYLQDRYQEAVNEVPILNEESDFNRKKREIMYLNLTRFMALLAHRKDSMSTSNGIEARMPFCSHVVAQYLFNVPFDMKMIDGHEKGILKRALRGILPDEVIQRKKNPFPKTHDPKYEVIVKRMLTDVLQDPNAPILNLVNKNEILRMVSEPSNYGTPFFGQLMSRPQLYAYLIQVDHWFREYKVEIK